MPISCCFGASKAVNTNLQRGVKKAAFQKLVDMLI